MGAVGAVVVGWVSEYWGQGTLCGPAGQVNSRVETLGV